MKRTYLIHGARQLLTMRGPARPRRGRELDDCGMIPDGSVLIRNGVILDVGPARRVDNLASARGAIGVNAAGRVVMPGFVDCRVEPVAGSLALSEYTRLLAQPSGEGDTRDAAAEVESVPVRRLEARTRTAVGLMAAHGTTAVEARTPRGAGSNTTWKALRVLRSLGDQPVDFHPSIAAALALPREGADRHLSDLAETLLPRVARRKLARFVEVAGDSPASDESIAGYLDAARRFRFEVQLEDNGRNSLRTARLSARFEAASIDCAGRLSDDSLRAFASGTAVILLRPGRLEPATMARTLIDRGAAVALATGYHRASLSGFNLQDAVARACAEWRMSPAEALTAATINAAWALRAAGETGSLEPGKRADLLLLNASDYREIAFCRGVNRVHRVMFAGRLAGDDPVQGE